MLYVEKDPRSIADPTTEAVTKIQLKPANPITKKLWQAVESLRDIDNLLDDIVAMSEVTKRRRRMKILATPLYLLYQSLRNVKNYFGSEKEYKNHPRKRYLKKEWEHLSSNIDMNRLKTVRDKLSGHIDKKLSIEQTEQIVQKTGHFDIAVWIHSCVLIFFELLDLQIYGWYTDDAPKGKIRLMVVEPALVTINQENGHPGYIEDVTLTQSPTHQIELICQRIVENTQWVFQEALEAGDVIQE